MFFDLFINQIFYNMKTNETAAISAKSANVANQESKVSKKLTKENVKKEVSIHKLMMDAYKESKAELYSLSGAIKNFKVSSKTGKLFLNAVKVNPEQITPKFILDNCTKVNRFADISGEIYQTVYIKGAKTDKLKVKWSLWDIATILKACKPE